MEKRQPTLADRFLANMGRSKIVRNLYHPSTLNQVVQGVRSAHKIVLDEQATLRLADVVMKIPQLIVREHQFARAPFDVTWIEFPSFLYWKKMRDANKEKYDRAGKWADELTADKNVGFLIDHERVNVIVDSKDGAEPLIAVHQYRMNTEWQFDEQLRFAQDLGVSRMMLDFLFWGETWDILNDDERRLLRGNNVAEWMPIHRSFDHAKHGPDVLRGAAGEFRTLIAILLLLNRPSLTVYKHTVPAGRGFIRNTPKPFMSYTSVTIDIDPVPTLQLVGTQAGEGVERRRHEVRGHYCHDQTARDYMRIAGCIHEWKPCTEDWTPIADDEQLGRHHHWMCAACGGKRWWRDAHERGNAGLGFVHHTDYRVTG